MISDLQSKIVESRNELKAQKVYSGLAYSSLLLPENTQDKTYSGTANLSGSGVVARVRFRFERLDGLSDAPMVNFTTRTSLNPTYKSFAESNGFTFSANDLSYIDTLMANGYIAELGDGYVDLYVDFGDDVRRNFFSLNSIAFSARVQAIANVKGTLTMERLI